jgi:hypothetical protein
VCNEQRNEKRDMRAGQCFMRIDRCTHEFSGLDILAGRIFIFLEWRNGLAVGAPGMIIITNPRDVSLTLAGLAVLFILAGFFYRQHQQLESQASIVRAYYGAVEAEHRLTGAEHRIQGLEFFYEYAIQIADNEAAHD